MFRHLNTRVYNTMQGPNEFVVTGTFKDWDRWGDLPRITVPSLLVGARFDTMKATDIEKMGALIPRSRVAICEQGSHCAMYDDQEAYFRHLLQFIGDVEAGAWRKQQ
jgi:proline iminopeptidase